MSSKDFKFDTSYTTAVARYVLTQASKEERKKYFLQYPEQKKSYNKLIKDLE